MPDAENQASDEQVVNAQREASNVFWGPEPRSYTLHPLAGSGYEQGWKDARVVTDEMVERAARSLAASFGHEWVFDEIDQVDPQTSYDADYWRYVAREALTAALSPSRVEEER